LEPCQKWGREYLEATKSALNGEVNTSVSSGIILKNGIKFKNPTIPIPRVSIIIPTYRHRDFILRTLDSVFAQTMRDYEIIVVNDGSPDDTKTVLAPLVESNHIRYVEQANQGQSRARNRGIELAHGQYIAFLDDDDVWPPDKLEWQAAYLDKNPDVALIGGVLQMMDEHGSLAGKRSFNPAITFESLFAENPFLSPGQTLMRTDVLKELGGMNANIWGADDWDLWFRIAKKYRIVMLDRLALYYRQHPGNASKQIGRLIKGACVTVEIHLKDVPQSQRRELRRTAHGMLYSGLGTLLLANAKKQLRHGRPLQAMRAMRGLLPLRRGVFFNPTLRTQFFDEVLFSPLRRLLHKGNVFNR
jgi:hypothetical protein